MAPTIVFNQQWQPILAVGSPGGSRIINYVAKTLAQHLAMNMPLDAAIAGPHIVHLNRHLELEAERDQEALAKALEERGHTVKLKDQTSGLHGIKIEEGKLIGVADPRREGSVATQ